MAIDRETIERRYRSDLEVAESWKESDPERYASERLRATERRAESLDELATARETEARKAGLAQARSEAIAAFPQADPEAVSGDTPEAIKASAERSHKFVQAKQEEAQKAAQRDRAAATRTGWTGSPTGRVPGIPGGEIRAGEESALQKQAEKIWDRTAEVIRQSRVPGTMRTFSDNAREMLAQPDVEAAAFADYRALHPNSGLSDSAMRARAEGTIQFAPNTPTGVAEAEEKRG